MSRIVWVAFVMVALGIASCNKNEEEDTSPNDTDRNFMKKTSLANTAEISLANLAVTKAVTPEITSFARAMITDHTRAQSELKNLAKSVNVPVADSIDAAHVILYQQLNALSGRAFDSAYIYSRIADHDNEIPLFQLEIDNGRNPAVKAYANNYKPQVQVHRQDANGIAAVKFPR